MAEESDSGSIPSTISDQSTDRKSSDQKRYYALYTFYPNRYTTSIILINFVIRFVITVFHIHLDGKVSGESSASNVGGIDLRSSHTGDLLFLLLA